MVNYISWNSHKRKVVYTLNSTRFSAEILLDLTMVLWLSGLPLRVIISTVLAPLGLSGHSQLLAGMVIYAPLLFYMITVKRRPWKYFTYILLCSILFFTITLLIHPEYEPWYTRSIYGVMYSVFRPDYGALWAFLIVELCENSRRLWENIKVYALVLALYDLYLLYQAKSSGYWLAFDSYGNMAEKNYSLDFGYDMVFIMMVAIGSYYQQKKLAYPVVAISAVFLLLQHGSRGAFICLLVFAALFTLTYMKAKKKIVVTTIVIILTPIFLDFNKSIMAVAYSLKDNFNISSRTIESILSNQAFDDSGRSHIYELAKAAIRENPLWGYGAFGDRPIIGPYYYWGYVHSIYYEFLINFGVVVGVCLLAYILYRCFRFIKCCKDQTLLMTFLIFFSMNMRLVISDSFWRSRFFWMTIALLFVSSKHFKKKAS